MPFSTLASRSRIEVLRSAETVCLPLFSSACQVCGADGSRSSSRHLTTSRLVSSWITQPKLCPSLNGTLVVAWKPPGTITPNSAFSTLNWVGGIAFSVLASDTPSCSASAAAKRILIDPPFISCRLFPVPPRQYRDNDGDQRHQVQHRARR